MIRRNECGRNGLPVAKRYGKGLFAVIAVLFLSASASAANEPAALVLDVSGTTAPQLEAFSEINTNTPVVLDADATVEFMHYAKCETVVLRGGRLVFSSQRYQLRGGQVVRTKRADCPKSVAISGASQIGGVVMRDLGGASVVRVSQKPSLAFIGEESNGYSTIYIRQDGKDILTGKLDGRVFHWPASAPALQANSSYSVTLGADGKPESKAFQIKVRRSTRQSTLSLIRVK